MTSKKKNSSFNSIQDPYFNESTKISVINLCVIKSAYLEKGIAIIKYVLMLILRGKTACRWQKKKKNLNNCSRTEYQVPQATGMGIYSYVTRKQHFTQCRKHAIHLRSCPQQMVPFHLSLNH